LKQDQKTVQWTVFPAERDGVFRKSKQVKFAFVEEHRKHVPVDRLCHFLGISSRGYRSWRGRPMSNRQRQDMILLAHIREQHHLSLGSYGRPRMTQELKEIGFGVGHRRVGRLMRQNAIYVVRTRKYRVTTDSNHAFGIAPNLLNQNFTADQPNQKWAGDISYLWTREGWLYLAVIIDLHSRKVVGWAVSNRLKHDLALQALNRAVALRNPKCRVLPAAFITLIAGRNIVLVTTKSAFANWDSKPQSAARVIVMTMPPLKHSSKH
jgi:transposase InsO family protein